MLLAPAGRPPRWFASRMARRRIALPVFGHRCSLISLRNYSQYTQEDSWMVLLELMVEVVVVVVVVLAAGHRVGVQFE